MSHETSGRRGSSKAVVVVDVARESNDCWTMTHLKVTADKKTSGVNRRGESLLVRAKRTHPAPE